MSPRTVCWWSAGVASAVAAKLAIGDAANAGREVVIVYCDTSATEHPDNMRFLADCERWYGQPILRIRSQEYRDTWDVFEKTGWLVGTGGARCTTELKKNVRRAFQRWNDWQVFGFTAEETDRAKHFKANNLEIYPRFPLIDAALSKADCRAVLSRAGVAEPAMYALGYRNNNCIGCVKGGAGYWNKIRRDFPEVFARMAGVERKLDAAICKTETGGKRVRLFLDELPPDAGRYDAEPEVECGIACEAVARLVQP